MRVRRARALNALEELDVSLMKKKRIERDMRTEKELWKLHNRSSSNNSDSQTLR